jgi:hypothetical protein
LTTPATNLPELTPSSAVPGSGPPSRAVIWRRRVWLSIKVIVFLWVGMVLVVMPWNLIWTQNSLVASNVWLHDLLNHGFVRGAVSGLGIVNLWIGIAEAVNYRE